MYCKTGVRLTAVRLQLVVTETVATAAQSRIGYALKVCVIVLITFERSVWTTSSCKHQTHAQVHNMYSCMPTLPIDDGRSEKKTWEVSILFAARGCFWKRALFELLIHMFKKSSVRYLLSPNFGHILHLLVCNRPPLCST